MTPEETGNLLGDCAAYDRRTVGEADVIAWHRIIGDLPYHDCQAAVIAHYTESREWIMPADIRSRVKRAQRDADGPRRLRDLLNPAAYRKQVEAADARTLALIQAKAGRTLAIDGPPPLPREHEPAPAGRVTTSPEAEALRQVAQSRELRGAEPEPP